MLQEIYIYRGLPVAIPGLPPAGDIKLILAVIIIMRSWQNLITVVPFNGLPITGAIKTMKDMAWLLIMQAMYICRGGRKVARALLRTVLFRHLIQVEILTHFSLNSAGLAPCFGVPFMAVPVRILPGLWPLMIQIMYI